MYALETERNAALGAVSKFGLHANSMLFAIARHGRDSDKERLSAIINTTTEMTISLASLKLPAEDTQ